MFSSSSQIIARLTPANHEARRAFNDVATRIVDTKPDTSDFLHAARFMVIRPHLPRGESNAQQDVLDKVDGQRGADDTGTETEAGETEAETETGAGSHIA
jgi:hypothetical protein